MSLQISSITKLTAPNNAPDTRLVVGVGEIVELTASQPVHWTVDGVRAPGGATNWTLAQFKRVGIAVVAAMARPRGHAVLHFTVVAPSVAVQKVGDVSVPPEGFAAEMDLKFTLTPLGVSFGTTEFRELNCPPSSSWGYFANGVAPNHAAAAGWAPVNLQNEVVAQDRAGVIIGPSIMKPWPLSAGGYEWAIPGEVRFQDQATSNMSASIRLPSQVVEAVQMDPVVASCTRMKFVGKLQVWKGGETLSRTFK